MYNYHRLKDLKEDKDLNQNDVAKIIKMSEKQYARYERGETDVPLQVAITLANYYKVSIDYIAGLTNDKRGLNKSDLPDSETQLIKKFRLLSSERKGKILERLDILTEEQEEENARIKGVI